MRKQVTEYLKLLKFIRPQVPTLILATACMFFSTIFNGVSLGMIIPISDRVLTNKEIIIPSVAKVPHFVYQIVNKLNTLEPLMVLRIIAAFIIALFFLKGFFIFLQGYLMNVVGQSCIRNVRNMLYRKFQDLSLEFYARKRVGELISRITNDVGLITQALSYGLTDLIYQSMQIALFSCIVFFIYWKLALVSFIVFPLIMFPVAKIGKRIKNYSRQTQQSMADLNSLLAETIQGAYIVKSFCREDYEFQRFKRINNNYYKFILKTIKRTIAVAPITEFIGSATAVIILIIAGHDVIAGKLSFGVFGLFLAALMSMIRPFKKLSNVHSINQQALAASQRIYAILEENPKIKENPNAENIVDFVKEISFDDVWFKYDEAKPDFILQGISFKVKKNEMVALVGPSGAGKTTIANLLPRFYDPLKGRITIDGRNIKNLKLKDLRSLIAFVAQEMVLFNDTVKDNIAYGNLEASEEDIIRAAKEAFAHDFIMQFPQGYNTVIGERGVRLSGGQKQRIAIARAMLKNSPILIFDEATSHLDSESEAYIKKAINNLVEGKTVFVIAHRLSTIQNADKIILLDKGKIVNVGIHQELLDKEPFYRRLYELQFKA